MNVISKDPLKGGRVVSSENSIGGALAHYTTVLAIYQLYFTSLSLSGGGGHVGNKKGAIAKAGGVIVDVETRVASAGFNQIHPPRSLKKTHIPLWGADCRFRCFSRAGRDIRFVTGMESGAIESE